MVDEKISVFENFHSKPQTISLNKWLEACRKGSRFTNKVLQYRQNRDPSLKKSLPLATVGAEMQHGRRDEHIIHRTGWIALDIDAKDNPHIKNAEALRNALARIVYIAFAGLSVSGNGAWALVKVSNPDRQPDHFEQLKVDFRNRGIVLDPTKGKNANDARFYSYDPDAIVKSQFKIYDRLPMNDRPVTIHPAKRGMNGYTNGTRSRVEIAIQQIQSMNIDIAPDYETYRDLGFAFASEFGESGRDLFHSVCSPSVKYIQAEADTQFTHCLNTQAPGNPITIGTFFYVARQHGIEQSRGSSYPSFKKDRPLKRKTERPSHGTHHIKLNDLGYPASWDDVSLENDSMEFEEAKRIANNDRPNGINMEAEEKNYLEKVYEFIGRLWNSLKLIGIN